MQDWSCSAFSISCEHHGRPKLTKGMFSVRMFHGPFYLRNISTQDPNIRKAAVQCLGSLQGDSSDPRIARKLLPLLQVYAQIACACITWVCVQARMYAVAQLPYAHFPFFSATLQLSLSSCFPLSLFSSHTHWHTRTRAKEERKRRMEASKTASGGRVM